MQDSSKTKSDKLIQAAGNLIKKHREKLNKTMYGISAEVGVPKATWREVELGLTDFRFTTIWKIAEGLNMPLYQLIKELQAELGDDFTLTD